MAAGQSRTTSYSQASRRERRLGGRPGAQPTACSVSSRCGPNGRPWELTTRLRRNMRSSAQAESRIPAELKRLDSDGLVRARKESLGWPANRLLDHRQGAAPPRRMARRRTQSDHLGVTAPAAGQSRIDPRHPPRARPSRAGRLDILDVGRTVAAEYAAGGEPCQDQVHVRAFVFDYSTTHATGMLDGCSAPASGGLSTVLGSAVRPARCRRAVGLE